MSKIAVCALYKFVALPEYQALRQPLLNEMLRLLVRGTLLLASEGINGTVAGSQESIHALLQWLEQQVGLAKINHKTSYSDEQPFNRTKVKLKKEIVTLGIEGIDPLQIVGTYVKAKDWNALIDDPEVLLVDTRNDYEIALGTFKNAIDPKTQSFRQFPDFVKHQLNPKLHKKVAMYCTGGIRCEKSTAYLKEQGFEEVYHLEGGILQYLQEIPEQESLWQGECYVFDGRVAVNHQLEPGSYSLCHACRLPITEQDKRHPHYQHGVSCPSCYETLSELQKQRFSEREKQIQLANSRGETHVGSAAGEASSQRRAEKQQHKDRQRIKPITQVQ